MAQLSPSYWFSCLCGVFQQRVSMAKPRPHVQLQFYRSRHTRTGPDRQFPQLPHLLLVCPAARSPNSNLIVQTPCATAWGILRLLRIPIIARQ